MEMIQRWQRGLRHGRFEASNRNANLLAMYMEDKCTYMYLATRYTQEAN